MRKIGRNLSRNGCFSCRFGNCHDGLAGVGAAGQDLATVARLHTWCARMVARVLARRCRCWWPLARRWPAFTARERLGRWPGGRDLPGGGAGVWMHGHYGRTSTTGTPGAPGAQHLRLETSPLPRPACFGGPCAHWWGFPVVFSPQRSTSATAQPVALASGNTHGACGVVGLVRLGQRGPLRMGQGWRWRLWLAMCSGLGGCLVGSQPGGNVIAVGADELALFIGQA